MYKAREKTIKVLNGEAKINILSQLDFTVLLKLYGITKLFKIIMIIMIMNLREPLIPRICFPNYF